MTWSRKFAKPIVLKDGRTVETLGEGRDMILSLPPIRQRTNVWRYAADLLSEAVADRASLSEAEAQLVRALKAERLT